MLKNHLKIALRFFVKNKLFTGINVFGLSIGITAFILLINYVAYERSYDDYVQDVDDLYRVTLSSDFGDKGFQTSATNYAAVGPTMLADFPEVEDYITVLDQGVALSGSFVLSYSNPQGEKIKSTMSDDHIYFATNNIIPYFKINMMRGDPENALEEPHSIILSSRIAKRFFGNEDPIGKMLNFNDDDWSVRVTGVFEEAPLNTHLPLGMVISYATFGNALPPGLNWSWSGFYTYVKLSSGTDPAVIESKFPDFVKKYLGDRMEKNKHEVRFGLQPVRDIHLKSHLNKEISANGNESTLYFLVIVAAFIIGIALINFINLSTAKSMDRAREVGIKKVVGAHRGMLIRQFLLESLLINFFAIILSIGLVSLLIPPFNELVGYEISQTSIWLNPLIWITMLSILLIGGLLAGLYPAFILSGFIPVQILKGSFQSAGKGLVLRKTLVVFQFAVSLALVGGTYIVYNQFAFMQNEKLGFDADQSLILPAPSFDDLDNHNKSETFREELFKSPNIKNITFSNEIPGKPIQGHCPLRRSFEEVDQAVESGSLNVDHNFFKTYNIPLLAGRDFNREDAQSYFDQYGPVRKNHILTGHKVIINQSAAKLLGFQNPEEAIDELVIFNESGPERTAQIIGVVDDYHHESLQQAYEPILFKYFKGTHSITYFTVKISGDVRESVDLLEEKYNSFFPGAVFKYVFLDEYFNRQYQAEERFGRVFLWFSVLAIFVAALGLFGLGSYTAMQKTREISVRKVLGANLGQALILIPAKLLGLVLISGIATLPLVYFAAKSWLDGYAFRMDMNIWMFIVPLCVVVLVAILSISVQSIRAALVNPAEALRNE
ncbi:MAG: ABC transporter permease [Bacteroidota bacterium]